MKTVPIGVQLNPTLLECKNKIAGHLSSEVVVLHTDTLRLATQIKKITCNLIWPSTFLFHNDTGAWHVSTSGHRK